ncbi:MAG: hypothetical protein JXQ83_14450 [Candidatus Glassbacteria bacterium]|nr:hypothetical protein [Candidatus Glassbacteria bacterium]
MSVLVWCLLLSFLAFGCHLAVWRIRIPSRQNRAILQIFFGVLVLGVVFICLVATSGRPFFLPLPESLPEYLQVILFFTSLTIAYLFTYSALIYESPSIMIMLFVADAGPAGLSGDDLLERMTGDTLIGSRLDNLVAEKMARLDHGRYRLLPKGEFLIKAIIFYRKLMNAPKGGG